MLGHEHETLELGGVGEAAHDGRARWAELGGEGEVQRLGEMKGRSRGDRGEIEGGLRVRARCSACSAISLHQLGVRALRPTCAGG